MDHGLIRHRLPETAMRRRLLTAFSRIPSFFCGYISMLAILNPEDDEARRCQGCHRAVTVALLEEYDWDEQVIPS